MTPLQAIILGLIEGITEYLPISSTGHLIIATSIMGLDDPHGAVAAFSIVIQGGAILAVLGLFRKRVMQMIRGILGRDAAGRKLTINLFISFLPAAIFGLLLADLIEEMLFYPKPVISALALGGIVMIALKKWQRRMFQSHKHDGPDAARGYIDIEQLTWKRALIIGLAQCLAMWPGTSRSMTTIVGGMFVGLRPRQAAEYSFLLGLPTLGGACVYKGVQRYSELGELGLVPLLLGLVVATLSAALAIKWLVGYLNKHGLAIFGWYRLLLASIIALMISREMLTIAPAPSSSSPPNLDHPAQFEAEAPAPETP